MSTISERTVVQGICIDPHTTSVRDDAIWAEQTESSYRVFVSIADVAAHVVRFSEIDRRAYERGFTRYNGSKTERMLPAWVSRTASLSRPEQHAVTVIVTLGKTLEIEETRVVFSVLKNWGALSFEEADLILSGAAHPLRVKLSEWSSLAERLRARRRSGGAIILDRLDGFILEEGDVDAETYGEWLEHSRQLSSDHILEEFVLLGSKALAHWCLERGVPILYRNHTALITGAERERLLSDIDRAYASDMPPKEFEALQRHVTAIFHLGYYGPYPEGHSTLNMLHTHWSSPLRRYADLLVHQSIRSELRGERHVSACEPLTQIAHRLNAIKHELNIKEFKKVRRLLEPGAALEGEERFIRDLRSLSREGQQLNDFLTRQIFHRARAHRLDVEAAFCILLLGRSGEDRWLSAKRDTLLSLVERPSLVREIFEKAHAELNWPLPIIDSIANSKKGFMGVARAEVYGDRVASLSGWRATHMLATEAATLSLLDAIALPNDCSVAHDLEEYALARNLRVPRYSVSSSAHGARRFRCIARTIAPGAKSGTVAISYAATEAQAHVHAARALLTKLVFKSL